MTAWREPRTSGETLLLLLVSSKRQQTRVLVGPSVDNESRPSGLLWCRKAHLHPAKDPPR